MEGDHLSSGYQDDNLSNVKILEHYGVDYPPEGPGWKTLNCPFHTDRNASARSNGQGFICNGCGVKGDSIALLMEREDIGYSSAFQLYEEITGTSYKELSGSTIRQRTRPNLSGETWAVERNSSIFSFRSSKRALPRSRPRLSSEG